MAPSRPGTWSAVSTHLPACGRSRRLRECAATHPAGWTDFLACAYGSVNHISGGARPSTTRLREEIGCAVLLIDTLDRRATVRTLLGEGSKDERWQGGDPDLIRHTEIAPAIVATLAELLSAGVVDYPAVGELLTVDQTPLQDWVWCSTPLIDECVAGVG